MKQSVYIETTVISYLTAKPSRDLVVAAHQQITLEWWEKGNYSTTKIKRHSPPQADKLTRLPLRYKYGGQVEIF